MSYEFGTASNGLPLGAPVKDDWLHDPVVVVVASGAHDVSRLVRALRQGTVEQSRLGIQIAESLGRDTVGRKALTLLQRHGGEDLTRFISDGADDATD